MDEVAQGAQAGLISQVAIGPKTLYVYLSGKEYT